MKSASNFSTKSYILGTTVLLSTHNILKLMGKQIFTSLRLKTLFIKTCDIVLFTALLKRLKPEW